MQFIYKRLIRNAFVVAIYASLPASYAHSSIEKLDSAPEGIHQFVKQVLPVHPRFIAAQAELDAVKSQYSAASKAIYNPELELDTEKTTVRRSTIGLSQTIDWGDQRGAKTRIAQYQLDAAQAVFERERQQLIRDLLSVLVDFQNKSRLADLSNQRLKVMEEFYHFAQQKRTAGDLDQVELNLAQLAYSESVLNNAQVLAEQANAEQAFYALYGSSSGSEALTLPNLPVNFQEISIPTDLDRYVMTLPRMRIVRANVDASRSTIGLRQSQSMADPTIAIRGGKDNEQSLANLTLTIPLNIRNNFRAEIDAARSNYLQAEQTAQQTFRNSRRDIVSMVKHYQLTRAAWNQWLSSGQISMNRQLELLKKLWRTGDLSTTDYLVQIKQNLDTQSAGIELNTTLWSSWLRWLEATAQIETWLQLNNARNP